MSTLLGFDFGGTKVDIGLGTADGVIIQQRRLKVADYPDLDGLMAAALAQGQSLAGGSKPAFIGVSTMGITHPDHVDLAPNVPGWSEIHLPERFGSVFGDTATAFENDVRSACLAELRWGALKSCHNAAYVNLGTGIAMSFVIDGRIYRGAHGASGEIAYLWRSGEDGYESGRAPFEEQYGGGGLDREIRDKFPPLQNLHDLFDRLEQPQHRTFFEERFGEIARRIGHILLAFDVERVVVGGGISRRFTSLVPLFEGEWRRHLPFAPQVVESRFVDRAGLYGALAVAAQGVSL